MPFGPPEWLEQIANHQVANTASTANHASNLGRPLVRSLLR